MFNRYSRYQDWELSEIAKVVATRLQHASTTGRGKESKKLQKQLRSLNREINIRRRRLLASW